MEQLQDFLFGADGSRFTVLAEAVGYLVAGPGNVILEAFDLLSSAESDEIYLQRQMTWAEPLGILFWIVVLLIVYWLRRPRSAEVGDKGLGAIAGDTSRTMVSRMTALLQSIRSRWSARDLWGAAWRAEAVHLALYVAMPLAMETLRVIVFFMFLPLTIMGVGDRGPFYSGTLFHMTHPVCWTFVSWCPSPFVGARDLRPAEEALCRAGQCPPVASRLVDPYGWLWKFVWAALSVTWIGKWRRKLRRPNGRPPSGP